MSEQEKVLEKLEKLKLRLKGKTLTMPNEDCKGVDYHLAGLFLKANIDVIIEALKRCP
jgi:hypothetical protein